MPLIPAEARVQQIIQQDGIHVVHFWAPWCGNSLSELRTGWAGLIENHPDVTFTFVTVWNGGASGRDELDRLGIPARVEEVTAPGTGTQEDKPGRRRIFLGLPMTWIPTTWVFHQNGVLAFAFNYGEVEAARIAEALADVRRDW